MSRHGNPMPAPDHFTQFACIDWSGAVSERPGGIAVASLDAFGAPVLEQPNHRWSRMDAFKWMMSHAKQKTDILIGLDLSFGFPFADAGSYFPHWTESPATAFELWAMIDQICTEDLHLSASSFLSHPQASRHFRHSKNTIGDLFTGGIGRLRAVESHQRLTKQANSWSCFNLVGAGQVGKSSLTGMRVLNRIRGHIPIWPFDPMPDHGPVILEIYTSMAARAAGVPPGRSKIRDHDSLNAALNALNCAMPEHLYRTDDHATDAILTAAWLRHSADNQAFWQPKLLNSKIAQTEGWTFGVI
jgi:hypothetical protein